jgi:lipoyl(octanoyl) transferase
MQWETATQQVDYETAAATMQAQVAAMQAGQADEKIWLVEHPPLYTAGSSAKADDLLNACFPVYETGRGGQYTYHGPGQRIAYVMLDLQKRAEAKGEKPDLRVFVQTLEAWVIDVLAAFGVKGEIREGRVGVWVDTRPYEEARQAGRVSHEPAQRRSIELSGESEGNKINPYEKKIAALGIRVQRWVTWHGLALNVCPDLSHYSGIVPCGIREFGVTSLHDLGVDVSMDEVDAQLKASFSKFF